MRSPAVSIGSLLAHPTLVELRSLCRPDTPDTPVNVVRLVADLGFRGADDPGALVVLLGQHARSDWRIDAFFHRAQRGGAAGVVVHGYDALHASTRTLVDRLGLTVLGSPDPLKTFEQIADLLRRPQTETTRVVLEITAVCWAGPTPSEQVVRDVARVLHREVSVLDSQGQPVIGPGGPDDERAFLAGHLAEAPTGYGAITRGLGPSVEVVLLRMPGVGETTWLSVRLPQPLPAERAAVMAALPIAAGAVQERLARRRLQLERTARNRTSLLEELTRSPDEVSQAQRGRALSLGWVLDGWHIGVYLGVLEDTDLIGAQESVLAAFAAEGVEVVAVEHGEGWALWSTSQHEPSTADAVQHAAAVRRAQRHLAASTPAYVGVGRAAVGASGIGASVNEARDAARIARGREETGRFLHVDRLGFGQLLLGWTRTDSFVPAAKALLSPLDGASGDLVLTLRTYLDCESSLAHTAAVLGVHRNTVAARVARVQELLGVDLDHPDERLALHLACKTVALPGGGAPPAR